MITRNKDSQVITMFSSRTYIVQITFQNCILHAKLLSHPHDLSEINRMFALTLVISVGDHLTADTSCEWPFNTIGLRFGLPVYKKKAQDLQFFHVFGMSNASAYCYIQ